jgi:tetratricopeptide (TPR) repeat protein
MTTPPSPLGASSRAPSRSPMHASSRSDPRSHLAALRPAWPPALRALVGCVALLVAAAAIAAPLALADARKGLDAASVEARVAAVERLGEAGTMADASRLVARLADVDENVREAAVGSMWQIWSRSGDPAIDVLFRRGLVEMQLGRLDAALETFTEIVRRKPAFAEGWNKRATLYFLLGRHAESLKDCAEVMKRNPYHFGALSGYAQIYSALGEPERALEWYGRALKVNPYLPNAAAAVRLLEEQIAAKRRSTT